jgi:hypothetical protein
MLKANAAIACLTLERYTHELLCRALARPDLTSDWQPPPATPRPTNKARKPRKSA